jgi:hypothetical protein
MRNALLGTILLLTGHAGWADHRPALTWEGDISGTAILRIQGDRVDVDSRSGTVSQPNYRFVTPLADAPDQVEVESRQGAARVRVLEQPRRNNNFTATVEVSAQGRRAQPVALDFYWADNRSSRTNSGRNRINDGSGTRSRADDRLGRNSSGTARWSGEVDNEVFVLMRGRQMLNTAVRGRNVSGQQADVSTPLPRRPVTVTLQDIQGRGQVELAEQPDDQNNYTAKVRIVDPQSGSGSYSFTLAWDEGGYGNQSRYPDTDYPSTSGVLSPGGVSNNSGNYGGSGGARWAGQVDGRVRVSFRDNRASSQRLSGQQIYGEQVAFGSPMPRRSLDVAVNKLRGRGDVNLVQEPSAQNNYTAIVEINDSDSGADVYELELTWR